MPAIQYLDDGSGAKISGTTTILSRFKESGGLTFWAHSQGAARLYEGEALSAKINKLTSALDQGHDATKVLHAAYQLGAAPKYPRLNDAMRPHAGSGTLVHEMADNFIRGREVMNVSTAEELEMEEAEYTQALKEAEKGFEAFMEWNEGTKINILATEFSMVCPEHKYGGTVDAVGVDGKGRFGLIDFKTSKGVYSDYLLQLGAYTHLLEKGKLNINQPATDTLDQEIPLGREIERAILLRFSKINASFHVHTWDREVLAKARDIFLAMVPLYYKLSELKRDL